MDSTARNIRMQEQISWSAIAIAYGNGSTVHDTQFARSCIEEIERQCALLKKSLDALDTLAEIEKLEAANSQSPAQNDQPASSVPREG